MDKVDDITDDITDTTAAEHWESQYADSERRWSGKVNPTTANVVATLEVGHVLDLGCGEGGDAVWFAEQGWQVTAVDLSPTAVSRGRHAATERGVGDRIELLALDLSTWSAPSTYDLVTATFFHSRTQFPRTEILRKAAARIRPGGHLLIVSHLFRTHEDLPPWVRRHMEETGEQGPPAVDLTPHDEIAALDLAEDEWEVVRAEIHPREATGPDGSEQATLKDAVTLLRRR